MQNPFLKENTMFAYREFMSKAEELSAVNVHRVVDQLKTMDRAHMVLLVGGALALVLWAVVWLAM
jgi:CHASE3 domain sensor protein